MRTISRYVLKEHAGPFVLGFALIIFVLLMDVVLQTMDQVLSKGVSPAMAGRLLFLNLAWIIALAVPMAVLMAVLMAFARLAADNEVMAAKACGVGFYRLLAPVLACAGVLTVLMVLFNDRILPDWNHDARNLNTALRRRKAALALKQMEGVVVQDLGSYSLLVRKVDEKANLLRGITIYDTRGAGPPATLHAPLGHLEILDDGSYLRLTLADGELLRFDGQDAERLVHATFARQVIHIRDPERALRARDSDYRSDRERDIASMRAAVREQRRELRESRRQIDSLRTAAEAIPTDLADSATVGAAARDRARLLSEVERHLRLNDNRQKRIDQFLVEIHKKFSIPVACMVFVLLGAPLGAVIRRRGLAVSAAVSLAFFWVYWVFLIGGEELADRGYVGPALAMWAPNLVFGLLGLLLTHRTAHDRPWLARARRRHDR